MLYFTVTLQDFVLPLNVLNMMVARSFAAAAAFPLASAFAACVKSIYSKTVKMILMKVSKTAKIILRMTSMT